MGNIDRRKTDGPNNEAAEQRGQDRRGKSIGPRQALRPDYRSGADNVRLHGAHRSVDSSSTVVYLKIGVLRQRTLRAGLPNRQEPH